MKLRVEIDPNGPEEVVVRARQISEETLRIQEAVDRILRGEGEIAVRRGEEECFLPCRELLFFETGDSHVWAHTAGECFLCPMRLHELIELLPRSFVRASKSCLINTASVRSLSRSPTGVGRATFTTGQKVAYISRAYYNTVRDTIQETRLPK